MPVILAVMLLSVMSNYAPAQHVVTNSPGILNPSSRPIQSGQSGRLFPHGQHAKLFPTCTGCHSDITSSNTTAHFPPAALCGACHNGTDAKRVEWKAPTRPAPQSLLAYSHRTHFAKTDSAGRECAVCHAVEPEGGVTRPGERRFMDVGHSAPATCFACHAHRTTEHYGGDTKCATCHVPLWRAVSLSVAQIADLPKPASHEARGFVAAHAPRGADGLAQCATCHARESCARCHVNAASLKDVVALGPDQRVAAVVRDKSPTYPVPDGHRREAFADRHGAESRARGATCANCHARQSCTACHIGPAGNDVIRTLPNPIQGPAGVRLSNPSRLGRRAGDATRSSPVTFAADTGVRTVRAHERGFLESHRLSAASGNLTCEGCHTQRYCADCHAGETRRAFHPQNFVAAHATDVYTADRDCASCHNTEVFCRACHQSAGLASKGGRAGTYHTAQQSQWLLQHGRAARQELTTCTTCHAQATCMRCHSTTGWGVSPHGSDFNAARLGKKAMAMCARCHITDPRRR